MTVTIREATNAEKAKAPAPPRDPLEVVMDIILRAADELADTRGNVGQEAPVCP